MEKLGNKNPEYGSRLSNRLPVQVALIISHCVPNLQCTKLIQECVMQTMTFWIFSPQKSFYFSDKQRLHFDSLTNNFSVGQEPILWECMPKICFVGFTYIKGLLQAKS